MSTKTYKKYITGLKGIACLFIMLDHFLTIYRNSESFPCDIGVLDFVYSSPLKFIFNEKVWMYLFVVISGYLISQCEVKNPLDWIKKSASRFVRFLFPVFSAYIVIFAIYKAIGFHNAETVSVFECSWFQSFYSESYSFFDVIKGPFRVLLMGNCELNDPFWMLRSMLLASIIIYFLKILMHYFRKYKGLCLITVALLAMASTWLNPIITASLLGFTAFLVEDKAYSFSENKCVYIFLFVLMIALSIFKRQFVSMLILTAVILIIPRLAVIEKLLSSAITVSLGKISWGVYSFHWAVTCSVGSLLLLRYSPATGTEKSFWIMISACTVITIIVSTIYHFTFEKVDKKLTSFFCDILK